MTTSVVSSDRRPAALASLEFLRAYVTTMRPYLLFVSGITGIVGMSLVPGVQDAAAAVVGIAFLAGTLPAVRAARKDPIEALRHE